MDGSSDSSKKENNTSIARDTKKESKIARVGILIDTLREENITLPEMKKSDKHEHKASLQRRLNAAQSSTRNMPDETLALIFELACGSDNLGPPQVVVLRLVSSLWRDIVDSTLSIWNWVRFCFPSDGDSVQFEKKYARQLDTCLVRSGTLPFDLFLSWDQNRRERERTSPIASVIQRNAQRFRNIELMDPPGHWLPRIKDMVNLASLELMMSLNHSPSLILPKSGKLRTLILNCRLYSVVAPTPLSTHNISVLNLASLPIDVVLRLLFASPNVVEFRAGVIRPPKDHHDLPTSSVVLQHLQIFDWAIPTGGHERSLWATGLLKYLHTPSLNTLIWYREQDYGYGNGVNPYALSFFSRLPSTLKQIALRGISPDESYLNDIPDVSNLTSLTCPRLIFVSFLDTKGDSVKALAKLDISERPKFPSDDFLSSPVADTATKVVQFLTRRFSSGIGEFNLFVDLQVAEYFRNNTKLLRALIEGGLKISINYRQVTL